jgi:ribonuclease P protein component
MGSGALTLPPQSASRLAPREVSREEDLSTPPQEPQAHPWVPQAHEQRSRQGRAQAAPPQGPQAADGDRFQEVVDGVARPHRFARRNRLARRPDFLRVQERGRRLSGSSYLLLALPHPPPSSSGAGPKRPRLGITVSKKVGKAVVRNQVKRWVRESYRRMSGLVPAGMDLVVVARPSATGCGYRGTAAELRGLLRRLGS